MLLASLLPLASLSLTQHATADGTCLSPYTNFPLNLIAVEPPREVGAPLGLSPLPSAPVDGATVALGKKLFFDRRLSFNDTMACGMCHIERQAFTSNQLATSVGIEGKSLRRNAPSLFNVVYETNLFRDGRENSLETQAWSPIVSPDEMSAPSVGWELTKVRSLPDYLALFEQSFPGRGVSMETVGIAIAALTNEEQQALVAFLHSLTGTPSGN